MLLMLSTSSSSEEKRRWLSWLSLVGIVPAFVAIDCCSGADRGATFTPEGGQPMVLLDNFANFLNTLFLLTGMLDGAHFNDLHWNVRDWIGPNFTCCCFFQSAA